MGKRGFAPKPTMLKLLQGKPGHHPLNKTEPKPKVALPRCPDHLDAEARREWRRVARQLYDLGILTRIDGAALAAYCQAWSIWVDATRKLQDTGLILKSKKTEVYYQNPLLAIANRAQAEMRRWIQEFGMTPSSRTGVHAQPRKEADDPLAKYLKPPR